MAAPTRYSLTYDFTGFQSANPNTPLPADKVEIEFNNIGLSIGETITNLGLIQRSDGKLQNKIVEFDSLSDATKALLGTTLNPRGDWAASTAYKVLDMVTVGESTYIAVSDHASGTSFTVDLTANKWQLWANPGFVDGTSFFQKFSGNGSTTAFTVSQDMGTDENGLMIFINNSGWVPQDPADYTINGTTLTFLAAPPNGTNNVFVFAPAKILAQAATYAAAAGTSASGAATSATNAAASASTASTAATNAGNSATAAATSATNAASSASSASTSASNASTSASGASTSATNAATSATAAASSATAAATSATNAASSASTASTAASTASTAASTASTAATAAAASAASVPLHVFDKTTDPTADDDSGDGYGVGSIWVNTVNDVAYMAVDVTVGAAQWTEVSGSGGGGGTTTVFAPADKYSPLKMTPTDGWANGNDDTGTPATHDASTGNVPSFTTAKKRSICIATVAGTMGGASVAQGELLMALQDNPTTADHWAIIADCTTEFEAAVEAAQGSPVVLSGTYLLKNADPDAAINLIGDYTILNQCGYTAIYQTSNNTRAALTTVRSVASAGVGVATGYDVDDEIGTTLQHVSYFVLSSPADISNFKINQRVEVFTDAVHVAEAGSSKGYISNVFVVTSLDTTTGTVYADRVIKYHNEIANAANIVMVPLHMDRSVKISRGALFMGAPSIIGGEVGWWLTLDGTNWRSGAISGSSLSRTIVLANADQLYLVGQGVRIGSVSGTPEATCKVTAVTSSDMTIEVRTVNDKGQAWTAPTTGTIYFVPAFWTTEFNTTTHGGALILQQAHGSIVECESARPWSSTVRARFSHYCKITVHVTDSVNIGTGVSGRSWRLVYAVENYSSSRNDISVYSAGKGGGGRHPYTSSTGTTSVAWSSAHWVSRGGCTCENKVFVRTKGDTGAAADTHALTNGDEIDSEVDFVTTYNTAHSYRGLGAQRRCENGITRHKQRGGQIGLRIANGTDYKRGPGSVDLIDIDVSELPLRADAHAFAVGGTSTNLPVGLMVQHQSAYTGGANGDRTTVTGRMKLKNAGGGFNFEADTSGNFRSYEHSDVGYALGWIQAGSKVHIDNVMGDYSITGGVATTSSTSVSLGSGSKSFTVATGLVITAGSNVLVQDSTSTATSRANYGWGRVVSYNSGTGALVVYLEGIKGSGTIGSWSVTIGAKIPRYGIALSGASTFTFGTMNWFVGQGANPTEVFHSRDNTSGKIVKGGVLIIHDPFEKGMPNIVTSGREADFTLQIGVVIYNGKVINSIGTGLVAGNFDGGGSVIPTNKKCRVRMPFAGTISRWYVDGDTSGSIVVDVSKNGTSMVGGGGNKPTLSSASTANAVPASWTTVAFAKGDIIVFNVDSVTTLTQATVSLEVQKV